LGNPGAERGRNDGHRNRRERNRNGRKLGEVSDVIAEARTDQVVEIVVKHGVLFGRGHTVLPLALVQRVEDGDVYVSLTGQALQRKQFVARLHADYTDYTGPPSQDNEGTFRGDLQFDS
jgi:uncharacterized protein YrrD